MKELLMETDFIDIIEAPGERIDSLGHGHFDNHPALIRDLPFRVA